MTETDLPDWAPVPTDRWAHGMRERLAEGVPAALDEFGRHLAAFGDGLDKRRRVTKTWTKRTVRLLGADGAPELARDALRLLVTDVSGPLVSNENRDLALGFVLAVGLAGEPAAVPDLFRLAREAANLPGTATSVRDDGLAQAAFSALEDLNHTAALDALCRLHQQIDYVILCEKHLAPVLIDAATRLGIPEDRRIELSVPAHGLTADHTGTLGPRGEGTIYVNVPFRAEITIEDPHTVAVTWIDDEGTRQRTTSPFSSPRGFKSTYFSHNVEVPRRHANRVSETLAAERRRLRDLPIAARWPFEEWTTLYRDHPITGAVAHGLIWEFEAADGSWTAALPLRDGFATLDGTAPPDPSDKTAVRLWHASRATPDEIEAWRARLAEAGRVQPFDQLTP
ncbi:DUF4132 domain-containing protein [Actinoallomurus sp. NPDC050550]|uniref:DUF4132 domain-containing protein n=1 Tax=Actinoallomurus sp. NPDC050550 TaxID=3154937 RepID=UPI0033DE32A7